MTQISPSAPQYDAGYAIKLMAQSPKGASITPNPNEPPTDHNTQTDSDAAADSSRESSRADRLAPPE